MSRTAVPPGDEQQGQGQGDDPIAPELRERPGYDNALSTLRRFREMVGDVKPIRRIPEQRRGPWVWPDPDADAAWRR